MGRLQFLGWSQGILHNFCKLIFCIQNIQTNTIKKNILYAKWHHSKCLVILCGNIITNALGSVSKQHVKIFKGGWGCTVPPTGCLCICVISTD